MLSNLKAKLQEIGRKATEGMTGIKSPEQLVEYAAGMGIKIELDAVAKGDEVRVLRELMKEPGAKFYRLKTDKFSAFVIGPGEVL